MIFYSGSLYRLPGQNPPCPLAGRDRGPNGRYESDEGIIMKLTLEQSKKRFVETFAASKRKTESQGDLIAGSFSRRGSNYGPHGIFVDRGEGAYIYTIDGKKLLDLSNNFTVNVLGHSHPAIVKAIRDGAEKGFSFGNPTDDEYRLAKILCDRIGSVEKLKFYCSASEACHCAVRIARGYTGKTKIAKFEGGYHGFVDNLSISAHPAPSRFPGPASKPKPLPDSSGIPGYETDNIVLLTQNRIDICEKLLRENAGDTACLIMELQSGAGGVVLLDKEFVRALREITKELGIVLIFDETVSLRADYRGFQHVYGVKPDLTVMGKMIGGGLPIGAVGGSSEVMSVIAEDQVQIMGTHHGHPLSAMAGIACMETLTEDAFARLNGMAARVKDTLNAWSREKGYPFVVYGGHSVLGFAFTDKVDRQITTHRDYWYYTDAERIFTMALEMAVRGYYPVHRGEMCFSLPITDAETDGLIDTMREIIESICT